MPLLVRSATKDKGFIASTSVFLTEVMKISACLMAIFYDEKRKIKQFTERIKEDIWYKRIEASVPAFVYALQNNLYYVALARHRRHHVQCDIPAENFHNGSSGCSSCWKETFRIPMVGLILFSLRCRWSATRRSKNLFFWSKGFLWIGVTSVVSLCWTSAFAGVYFEKMLNLMTLLFAGGGMALGDGVGIRDEGFFHGWSPLVWTITIINSVGGLAVSLVMKYAC